MTTNRPNIFLLLFLIAALFVAGCKDKDEVIPAAVITSLSEEYGLRGSTLTITGSDFNKDAIVDFNGVEATPTSVGSTEIVVMVPEGATTGPISIVQGGMLTEGPSYHVYTPAKHLYFTEFFAYTVNQIDLINNSSQSVVLYDEDDGITTPVAIDISTDGYLYVTGAYYVSEIYKMPYGSKGNLVTLYDEMDGLNFPSTMVVGNDDGMIYWSNVGTEQFMKAPVTGKDLPTTLFNGNKVLNDVYGLKIDFATGDMYFCDPEYINKMNLTGSATPDVLYSPDNWPDMEVPSNIVIDVPRGKMYWTDEGSAQIVEANLDGTGTPIVLFDTDDGLVHPSGLGVDYASGTIYWTDIDWGMIFKGNLDGSGSPVEMVYAENSYGLVLEFEE